MKNILRDPLVPLVSVPPPHLFQLFGKPETSEIEPESAKNQKIDHFLRLIKVCDFLQKTLISKGRKYDSVIFDFYNIASRHPLISFAHFLAAFEILLKTRRKDGVNTLGYELNDSTISPLTLKSTLL